jgi:hypothetical protein
MSHELDDRLRRFMAAVAGSMKRLELCQNEIRDMLVELRERLALPTSTKEAYSPAEAAKLLGRRPYTVREWCRLGRIKAKKRPCGRGAATSWEISHGEIERIQNHGLLPIPKRY